jgi:hypothetical protein
VGRVVQAYEQSPGAFRAAVALPTILYPPAGVTLTNALNPDDGAGGSLGGYVVVSIANEPVVIQHDPSDVTTVPRPGQRAYLTTGFTYRGGFSASPPGKPSGQPHEFGPLQLGTISNIGPGAMGSTSYSLINWQPDDIQLQRGVLSSAHQSLSSVLDYVPNLGVATSEGHTYKIKAYIPVSSRGSTLNTGGKIVVTTTGYPAFASWSATFFRELDNAGSAAPALMVALSASTFDDVLVFPRTTVTRGYWILDGTFKHSSGGGVVIMFAQEYANGLYSSSIMAGAYLEVSEQ